MKMFLVYEWTHFDIFEKSISDDCPDIMIKKNDLLNKWISSKILKRMV